MIESFKFIGKQAYKLEVQQMNQLVSFGTEYRNVPANELLRLIDKYPELKESFVECISDFIS